MQKLNTFLTLIILFSSGIQSESSKKQKHIKSSTELNKKWLSQWDQSYNAYIVQQLIKDDKLSLFHSEKSESKQFDLIMKAARSAKLEQNCCNNNSNDWTSKAIEVLHKAPSAGKELEKIRKKEIIDQINKVLLKNSYM